jgi:hypothetical protein
VFWQAQKRFLFSAGLIRPKLYFHLLGHLLKIGLGPIENSNFLDTQSIAAGKLNRD